MSLLKELGVSCSVAEMVFMMAVYIYTHIMLLYNRPGFSLSSLVWLFVSRSPVQINTHTATKEGIVALRF